MTVFDTESALSSRSILDQCEHGLLKSCSTNALASSISKACNWLRFWNETVVSCIGTSSVYEPAGANSGHENGRSAGQTRFLRVRARTADSHLQHQLRIPVRVQRPNAFLAGAAQEGDQALCQHADGLPHKRPSAGVHLRRDFFAILHKPRTRAAVKDCTVL